MSSVETLEKWKNGQQNKTNRQTEEGISQGNHKQNHFKVSVAFVITK